MNRSELIFGTPYNRGRDKDLAAAAGVSVSTIRRWRKHPERMTLDQLRTILRLRAVPDEQRLKVLR